MWVGLVLILTINGVVVSDAAIFATKAECVREGNSIGAKAAESSKVKAFRVDCVEYPKGFHDKKNVPFVKPEAKPSDPINMRDMT